MAALPLKSNLTSFLATVEVKMGVWPRIGLKKGQVTFQSRNSGLFLNYFFLAINTSACSNSSAELKGTSAAYTVVCFGLYFADVVTFREHLKLLKEYKRHY